MSAEKSASDQKVSQELAKETQMDQTLQVREETDFKMHLQLRPKERKLRLDLDVINPANDSKRLANNAQSVERLAAKLKRPVKPSRQEKPVTRAKPQRFDGDVQRLATSGARIAPSGAASSALRAPRVPQVVPESVPDFLGDGANESPFTIGGFLPTETLQFAHKKSRSAISDEPSSEYLSARSNIDIEHSREERRYKKEQDENKKIPSSPLHPTSREISRLEPFDGLKSAALVAQIIRSVPPEGKILEEDDLEEATAGMPSAPEVELEIAPSDFQDPLKAPAQSSYVFKQSAQLGPHSPLGLNEIPLSQENRASAAASIERAQDKEQGERLGSSPATLQIQAAASLREPIMSPAIQEIKMKDKSSGVAAGGTEPVLPSLLEENQLEESKAVPQKVDKKADMEKVIPQMPRVGEKELPVSGEISPQTVHDPTATAKVGQKTEIETEPTGEYSVKRIIEPEPQSSASGEAALDHRREGQENQEDVNENAILLLPEEQTQSPVSKERLPQMEKMQENLQPQETSPPDSTRSNETSKSKDAIQANNYRSPMGSADIDQSKEMKKESDVGSSDQIPREAENGIAVITEIDTKEPSNNVATVEEPSEAPQFSPDGSQQSQKSENETVAEPETSEPSEGKVLEENKFHERYKEQLKEQEKEIQETDTVSDEQPDQKQKVLRPEKQKNCTETGEDGKEPDKTETENSISSVEGSPQDSLQIKSPPIKTLLMKDAEEGLVNIDDVPPVQTDMGNLDLAKVEDQPKETRAKKESSPEVIETDRRAVEEIGGLKKLVAHDSEPQVEENKEGQKKDEPQNYAQVSHKTEEGPVLLSVDKLANIAEDQKSPLQSEPQEEELATDQKSPLESEAQKEEPIIMEPVTDRKSLSEDGAKKEKKSSITKSLTEQTSFNGIHAQEVESIIIEPIKDQINPIVEETQKEEPDITEPQKGVPDGGVKKEEAPSIVEHVTALKNMPDGGVEIVETPSIVETVDAQRGVLDGEAKSEDESSLLEPVNDREGAPGPGAKMEGSEKEDEPSKRESHKQEESQIKNLVIEQTKENESSVTEFKSEQNSLIVTETPKDEPKNTEPNFDHKDVAGGKAKEEDEFSPTELVTDQKRGSDVELKKDQEVSESLPEERKEEQDAPLFAKAEPDSTDKTAILEEKAASPLKGPTTKELSPSEADAENLLRARRDSVKEEKPETSAEVIDITDQEAKYQLAQLDSKSEQEQGVVQTTESSGKQEEAIKDEKEDSMDAYVLLAFADQAEKKELVTDSPPAENLSPTLVQQEDKQFEVPINDDQVTPDESPSTQQPAEPKSVWRMVLWVTLVSTQFLLYPKLFFYLYFLVCIFYAKQIFLYSLTMVHIALHIMDERKKEKPSSWTVFTLSIAWFLSGLYVKYLVSIFHYIYFPFIYFYFKIIADYF